MLPVSVVLYAMDMPLLSGNRQGFARDIDGDSAILAVITDSSGSLTAASAVPSPVFFNRGDTPPIIRLLSVR